MQRITVESRTLSVRVDRSSDDVYDFVAQPANLPTWAAGLGTSIALVGGEWIADTPQGPAKVRFAEQNTFGVLDHFVSAEPGIEVYIPMRVIANGHGSEILFTLLRLADMSDATFAEDAAAVERDLKALKLLLEA